eukprot:scaffold6.g2737.t1
MEAAAGAPCPLAPPAAALQLDGGCLRTPAACLLADLAPEATVRLDEGPSGGAIISLGNPSGVVERADCSLAQLGALRFVALGRTSLWWMAPAWGSSAADIPEETQLLLLELEGGGYGLLLPLIADGRLRATLRPPGAAAPPNRVVLRIESGGDRAVAAAAWPAALYVAAGACPFELLQRGVTAAAALSGAARPRAEKEVPSFVDDFGWCTCQPASALQTPLNHHGLWARANPLRDAFYSKVSAAGIAAGLNAFAAGGVSPRFVIIDDGWQQTDVDLHLRGAAEDSAAGAQALGVGSAIQETAETIRSEGALQAQAASEQGRQLAVPATTASLPGVLLSWLAGGWRALLQGVAQLEACLLGACKAVLDSQPTGKPATIYACLLLTSVRANAKFSCPDAGPEHALNSTEEGLAGVVASIKSKYSVRSVMCWHSIFGFWGGLGLADPEMAKYKPCLLHPQASRRARLFLGHSLLRRHGRRHCLHATLSRPSTNPHATCAQPTPGILAVDPSVGFVQPVLSGVALPADPAPLYSDMHSYLAAAGVDGVKVDVQSTLGLLGSVAGSGPALAAAYHAALEDSVSRHFPGNTLINCMSHSSEDLYCLSRSAVVRASDDFYPRNPASWAAHIANCAFNSLLIGELAIPDWDMWHSKHPAATAHAVARAVSGGPCYVSDRPGCTDFELVNRLVLPDGSVLRTLLPGRPTADVLFQASWLPARFFACRDPGRDGTTTLKVWSVNAYTGVVAAFNVQGSAWSRRLRRFHTHDPSPAAVAAHVRPRDVPALAGAAPGAFAVYRDSTKELRLVSWDEAVEVELPALGADIVCISPVATLAGVEVAPVGATAMLNAGCAVRSCRLALRGGGGAAGEAAVAAEDGWTTVGSGGSTGSTSAWSTMVDEDGGAAPTEPSASVCCEMQLRGCGPVLVFASRRPAAVVLGGQAAAFEYDAGRRALTFELPAGDELDVSCVICF